MGWLADVVSVLTTAGVGTLGTDLFATGKAVIPAGTSTQVTETGGSGPGFIQNTTNPSSRNPAAQIKVRAASAEAAKTKIEAAYRACLAVRNQVINGNLHRKLTPLQEPYDLGVDERGLSQYVFNVLGDYNDRS